MRQFRPNPLEVIQVKTITWAHFWLHRGLDNLKTKVRQTVDKLPKKFHDLALRMAQNHIYLSVRNENYFTAARSFLKKTPRSIPSKIVAVVGAGASNDACGLPTGAEAADRLINAFVSGGIVKRELIMDEIHRITVEYRLEQGDFEAALLALSKFDQKTVLHELNAIYNRRHYPSLTYEILAHLLKHRFIDAIVNFNFDELLDQAIDDELGRYGYYRVISDGDCPDNIDSWKDDKDKPKERFKFPLYIKPHGTASHKSTMRFTRSSYSLLPIDLVRLLESLFAGPVDVIVVGHAMQSVEFNDILTRSDGGMHFYTIGHTRPKLRVAGRTQKWDMEFFDSQSVRGGLDSCIEVITKRVEDMFKDGFKPRSISRHKLISKLFKRKAVLGEDTVSRDKQHDIYLRDRIYVEIALAISKAKGFISLEHLVRGRAGQYFRLLRRHAKGSTDSMLSMCEGGLNLNRFGYSGDTFWLPGTRSKPSRNRLRHLILPKQEFEGAAQKLSDITLNHLDPKRHDRCVNDDELYLALMDMYEGEETEISNNTNATMNDTFVDAIPLPTLTSLYAQTSRMIAADISWEAILCTAESGKWLLKKEWSNAIKNRQAALAVIVADQTHSQDLKNRFGDNLGKRLRWLPWWLHNRHVTVLIKNKQPDQAIFFERRLRTSHIAPMWLRGADVQIAMDAFVAYWIKANQYKKSANDIEIRPDQLRSESEKLIAELYANRNQTVSSRSKRHESRATQERSE
jgi:SIR2-like domain